MERRLPVGAEVQPDGGVHFRVWAPRRRNVQVAHSRGETPLTPEGNGYFSAFVPSATAGTSYRLRLDGGESFPDPASRFQPDGPHGASEVVDPSSYRWQDGEWRGVSIEGQVIYEMHVGTFTREGTWAAAYRELTALARLGVTVIEVMPVADFAGRFGWGYDGVNLFAPTRLYGPPDHFRRFVDCAHRSGIGVILDVVYNHVGPSGNYLREFAHEYFTDRYDNEWGDAINFDGIDAAPVREFFLANAGYWIDEFHLDGLRLDATQQVFDRSPSHIVGEISRRVREAARGRRTIVVAENEAQEARMLRQLGVDALWNDDFHHAAHVALTAHNEAYYTDYVGSPQELLSATKRGFLYQGQWYSWQGKKRGTPALDVRPASFVHYIQNHDQVANSGRGTRIHDIASRGRWRAMTALLLLGPPTPMLFQGQEFAASSPFLFFADHEPELAAAVRKGRAEFLSQFPNLATPEAQAALPDPGDPATFERCKLDLSERERNAAAYALHADLLALRRADMVFAAQSGDIDGAVLGDEALVLRYFGGAHGDRLVVVNLGPDLVLSRAPEPLLAPPEGREWRMLWSSEDERYDGEGTPPVEREGAWRLPGRATVVFAS